MRNTQRTLFDVVCTKRLPPRSVLNSTSTRGLPLPFSYTGFQILLCKRHHYFQSIKDSITRIHRRTTNPLLQHTSSSPKMSTATMDQTVSDILHPLTSSTATSQTITTAVDKLTSLLSSTPPSSQDESTILSSTFSQIFNLIKTTPPPAQSPIIDFLTTLQTRSTNPPRQHESMSIWSELPTFGWTARDYINFDLGNPNVSASERESWTNIATFLAKLTSLKKEVFDFSLFGLWSIREGLEEEGNGEDGARLAAVWLTEAGGRLKELSDEGKSFEGRVAIPGSKFGDKSWRGFSKDRWGVWKSELQGWKEKVNDEGCKDLVGKALALM
ncbi:hypothetical protein QBC42DRAFT_267521 [Cladorrhinum samala]|uniref:Uncharacterized protein n=1 Tax=Cladorrhinum samala TaxID=585594 RepID=A0AAV9HSY5_9PEZI|nr:hypothetical protein QBC42DRAFT_267521 [Cladorrhinum samala]